MSDPLKAFPVEAYIKLERDSSQWVIRDLIPTCGLVNLYSSPKAGKTMLTMHFALAIADPDVNSCLGLPIVTHGRVLYIQLDTPRNQWAFRLERALSLKPIPPGQLFIIDRLTCPQNFNIAEKEHKEWLKAQVSTVNPIVTFIDTIRESHSLDEDNAGQMKQVVAAIVEAIPNSAIVFLSHSRKSMQGMSDEIGNIIDDARGSGYIAGRMDSIIKITKRMLAYQTRAGKGEFAICQLEKTGEIRRQLNDKAFLDYIRELTEKNPTFPVETYIQIIQETIDVSREVAINKLNQVLQEKHEEPPPPPPPKDASPPSENLKKALKSLKDIECP